MDSVTPPRDWINPRRKRFWLVIVLLLYTLAGFFLVPWIARDQITSVLSEQLQRPVKLESMAFNPWVLSAEARDFRIDDRDGSSLVAFDRLYINFQVSSLFRWAYTFRDIRLEGPRGHFVRHADGSNNFSDLLPPPSGEEETEEAAGPPRLVIGNLDIEGGALTVTDRTRATPFTTTLTPIGVGLKDISTLPDDSGRYGIVAESEQGARLAWQGDLQVQPLLISGRLEASGPWPLLAYRYFEELLNVQVDRGRLDLALDYRVAETENGVSATLDAGRLDLRDLAISDKGSGADLLALDHLKVGGLDLAWPQQTLSVDQVSLVAPRLEVRRRSDGELNLLEVLDSPTAGPPDAKGTSSTASGAGNDGSRPEEDAGSAGDATPVAGSGETAAGDGEEPASDNGSSDQAPEQPPQSPRSSGEWALKLTEFTISDMTLGFEDRTLRRPAPARIADLDLTLRNLSNEPGARFPLEASIVPAAGGTLTLTGELGALPQPALDADLQVDALPVALAQPWLRDLARVTVADGTLAGTINLRITDNEPFAASGKAAVNSFAIKPDSDDEKLLAWERVAADGLRFSTAENALEVSEVAVESPYLRLHIDEDQNTNIGRLLITSEEDSEGGAADGAGETATDQDSTGQSPEETAEQTDSDADFHLFVGRVGISDGSADFSDLSLPIPYRTRISALGGEISTLNTQSAEPATLDLEGQVADYGMAQVKGSLDPAGPSQYANLSLLFRNVVLPDLSPYVIKFAGRRVREGRMDLDLAYTVENGQLSGNNNLVIRDFQLGEKVDYEGAMNLPLDLAVALLKGPDGNIDLNVPVEGDVDNPSFDMGSVVRQALAKVITSAATAPFKFLGSLIGADSEDFHQLDFAPGRAELTPPEREDIEKLAEALKMRPQLGLLVPGALDRDLDVPALRRLRVDERIEAALAERGDADDTNGYTEHRQAVLETLFRQQFPDTPLESVREAHRQPEDPEAPEGRRKLDRTAYLAALRERLVDAETIDDAALEQLATARARTVIDVLTDELGIDPSRIRRTATPDNPETRKEDQITLAPEVESLSKEK